MIGNLIDLVGNILSSKEFNPYSFGFSCFIALVISSYLGFKVYSNYIHKKAKVKKSEIDILNKLIESKDKTINDLSNIALMEDLFYKYTKIRTNVVEISLYIQFYKEMGGSFSFTDIKEIRSYLKVFENQVTIKYSKIDTYFSNLFFCFMLLVYGAAVFTGVVALYFNSLGDKIIDIITTLKLFVLMISLLILCGFLMALINPIRRAQYFKKILDTKRGSINVNESEKKKKKLRFSLGNQWSNNDTKVFFICMIMLIFWFMFENKLINKYNREVVSKYLILAEDNIIYFWVFLVCLLVYTFFGKASFWEHKTFIPYRRLMIVSSFISLYSYYWWKGSYYSYSAYCSFGALDWFVFFVFVFVFFGYCFNQIIVVYPNEEKRRGNGLQRDEAIKSFHQDLFNFGDKVKAFVREIDATNLSRRLSIGINGHWGEGKSSYANLMIEEFKSKEGYIILEFNPRHSKAVNTIQFDFFQLLYESLKDYDARFTDSFNKYLIAIQVIDKSKIFDFLNISQNAFFDKEDEKELINKAISRIGKKVVVFIEDLDRLLAEEIIEVFKLIDGTASFTNFIFITCFDKEHISKVISKLYVEGDTFFSDKFFDIEKRIPLIEEDLLLNEFKRFLYDRNDNVIEELFNDKDKEEVEKVVKEYRLILRDILLTPRDVVRFVNIFKQPYLYFRDNVLFEDYLLLTLLKYKYNDVYRQLFYSKIVNEGSSIHFLGVAGVNSNQIYLNKTILEENIEVIDCQSKILKSLFEKKDAILKSINHKDFYMIYFREYYDPDFSLVSMMKLLVDGLPKSVETINRYISSNNIEFFNEFLYKVYDLEREEIIRLEQTLYNYIEIIVYVLSKYDDFNLRMKLLQMLDNETVEELIKIETINDKEKYIKEVKHRLKGTYPNTPYDTIGSWITDFIDASNGDRARLILNKDELLDINKSILKELIEKEAICNQKHLDVLYNCIDSIDKDQNRAIHLDKEACSWVKELIEENPKEYLDNFVRLGQKVVNCEPFCIQVFGGEDNVDKFINDDRFNDYLNIKMIRNVWSWYRLNEFNYIKQDCTDEEWARMIDSDFEEEAKKVAHINLLRKDFILIRDNLKPILDLVNDYSPSSLNVEYFVDVCEKDGVDLGSYLEYLEKLLNITKELEKISLNAVRKDEVLNFDWIELKLLDGGRVSELEEVIDFLHSRNNDNYNEDKDWMK